jgi:PKD repeat protein
MSPGAAVAFSGSGSSDPDGDSLTYAWSFGDGAQGTGATVSHTYSAAGSYTATLVVDDGHGGTAPRAWPSWSTAPSAPW